VKEVLGGVSRPLTADRRRGDRVDRVGRLVPGPVDHSHGVAVFGTANSVVAVTGGTGAYRNVCGEMELKYHNPGGIKFDFVFHLIGCTGQTKGEAARRGPLLKYGTSNCRVCRLGGCARRSPRSRPDLLAPLQLGSGRGRVPVERTLGSHSGSGDHRSRDEKGFGRDGRGGEEDGSHVGSDRGGAGYYASGGAGAIRRRRRCPRGPPLQTITAPGLVGLC